jgi:hypothetical protein
MEPDDLLCSRNARSRTPLVGRAQWKINQPPSLGNWKDLARRPQSKAPRALAWLSIELEERVRMDAHSEEQSAYFPLWMFGNQKALVEHEQSTTVLLLSPGVRKQRRENL